MASIKGWTLKNVKTWQGREGEGAQGSIYYKGKKVGWYNDSADGGPVDIEIVGKELREQLALDAKAYYTEHPDPLYVQYNLEPDADLFFTTVMSLMDKEKQYKKYANKGYSLVIVKEQVMGWTSYAARDVSMLDTLLQRYGLNRNEVQVYTCLDDFNI